MSSTSSRMERSSWFETLSITGCGTLDWDTTMGCPTVKWSAKDQKQSGIMVELIEEQLLERRIMRNLERLFGAMELGMDYRGEHFGKDETIKNIRVILQSIHSDDGNPTSANIKQALRQSSLKSRSIQDKAFQRRQSFQDKQKYEHVGPEVKSSQEGKRSQDDEEIMFD
ncbi:hypothetical protein Tco_0959756 [Tanacetum coccineum]